MISKSEALYVKHPVAGRRCADCKMFQRPSACTLVEGPISPDGHCRFWEVRITAAKSFADIMKDEPSGGDVHVATAIGNSGDRPRSWKPFGAIISGQTPRVVRPRTPGQSAPATSGPTPVKTATSPPAFPTMTPSQKAGTPKFEPKYRSYKEALDSYKVPHKPAFPTMTKVYGSTDELPQVVRDRFAGKPKKLRQWMHVWNSSHAAHGDEGRAFASAWAAVQKATEALSAAPIVGLRDRQLQPFDHDTYHVPFHSEPAALGQLRPDQAPRFLDAVTHPKRLGKVTMSLHGLNALKDRVSHESVTKHLDKLNHGKKIKPPVVVRLSGANLIADGHDRLAAKWLNGDDDAEVHYLDLEPYSEAKPDPKVDHKGSRFNLLQPANGRRLNWNENGTLAVPFSYDPGFLGGLRSDQVPRFLWAITHQDDVPTATVKLSDLHAIQDRVNPDTVAAHVEDPSDKLPVVIHNNGGNYIGDGHDRLSAAWLAGADEAKVHLYDLGAMPSNAMKRGDEFDLSFELRKADPDQRLIFGWASIVTKNGRMIVDHQGDMISPEELEKAFYDYVLYARDQGHMHSTMGVGRLIECAVFTKQKQDILKIVIKDEDGDQIEGAWVGYFVDDDGVWAAHKRGELPAFSIGGAAVPIEVTT